MVQKMVAGHGGETVQPHFLPLLLPSLFSILSFRLHEAGHSLERNETGIGASRPACSKVDRMITALRRLFSKRFCLHHPARRVTRMKNEGGMP